MIIGQATFCIVVFIALTLAILVPQKAQAFSGSGDGLDEGTAYQITNCSQLQEIKDDLNAWYRLENDIDCSETSTWNSGAGFEPIGNDISSFHGVLRGNNYTIIGLTINRPTTDNVGLFGYIGGAGSVDKLRLKEVSIIGQNNVGSIAGQTVNGDVFNVGVSGEVTGADIVGGVVGSHVGAMMNVYSHVNIGGTPTIAGGLVGYLDTPIFDSYSTGTVPTGLNTGGLVGIITDTIVYDSFWDTETSGQATSAAGTGKTTAQLKTITTFTDTVTPGLSGAWDFVDNPNDDSGNSDFWDINPLLNNGYPYLVAQTPGVPETFITDAPSSPTNDTTLTFEFNTNVSSSVFECKLDDSAYAPCTSPYTTSPLADGEHTFLVKAINTDGVEDQSPTSTTKVIDTVTPITSLSLIDPPIGRDTSIYEFSSNEPSSTFECSFNGSAYEPCVSPYTTPALVEGDNIFRVRSIDAAGNIEDLPASDTWNMVLATSNTSSNPTEYTKNSDAVLANTGKHIAAITFLGALLAVSATSLLFSKRV